MSALEERYRFMRMQQRLAAGKRHVSDIPLYQKRIKLILPVRFQRTRSVVIHLVRVEAEVAMAIACRG